MAGRMRRRGAVGLRASRPNRIQWRNRINMWDRRMDGEKSRFYGEWISTAMGHYSGDGTRLSEYWRSVWLSCVRFNQSRFSYG